MKITTTVFAAALVAVPSVTFAQGFVGAELSGSMMAYSSDTDLGETMYNGGLEFGIVPGLSVAADFAYHGFRGLDGNSSTLTVHGLYDLTQTATVGLFYGQDRRDAGDSELYGIEGATTLSGIAVDGYLGQFDGDMGTGMLLGVNGAFAFTDAISATASAGIINGDENWKRISIGGEYQFGNGPTVFAEVGKYDGDVDGENFISIGARIELGQGTTFGPRGITEILPGF